MGDRKNKDVEIFKRKGRPPGSKNNSRNNLRNQSPLTPPNKYAVLVVPDDAWLCRKCNKIYDEEDAKLLECQRCRDHYCIDCLNKTVAEYNILANSDTMWFCIKCREKVEKNINMELNIEKHCKEIMERYECRIQTLEKGMEEKCNIEDVKKIVQEEMASSSSTNSEINLLSTQIQKESEPISTTSIIQEMNEIANRANNIVFFGLAETAEPDREKRKETEIEDIKEIAEQSEVTFPDEIDIKIQRLGKFTKYLINNRPLLLTLPDPTFKKSLFRNAHKLKENDGKFSKIYMNHDMTRTGREEDKKLRDEAKQMQENSTEKNIYRVRGPPGNRKIVKLPPHPNNQ